jgi:hypothetical protein
MRMLVSEETENCGLLSSAMPEMTEDDHVDPQ